MIDLPSISAAQIYNTMALVPEMRFLVISHNFDVVKHFTSNIFDYSLRDVDRVSKSDINRCLTFKNGSRLFVTGFFPEYLLGQRFDIIVTDDTVTPVERREILWPRLAAAAPDKHLKPVGIYRIRE